MAIAQGQQGRLCFACLFEEDEERAHDKSKNNIDKESAQRGYEVRNRMEQHFSVVMWNMFNCQTDMIDDDNDDSSSINNDWFQFTTSSYTGDDEMSTCYNKNYKQLPENK